MTGKHLCSFEFDISADDLPRTKPDGPFTDEGQVLANQMVTAIRRTSVLATYIDTALRQAKAVVCDPPASMVFVTLRRGADPEPARSPPPAEAIVLDIPVDPRDLPGISTDRETQGHLHLRLAREAATHLRKLEGFPEDAIEQGCKAFEDNNFAIWFKAGEKLIPGTQLKGKVAVEVTPETTTRWLYLSYRGTELARTKLHAHEDGPDFTTSRFFRPFRLNGTVIEVDGDPFAVDLPGRKPLWPAVHVDLQDHPNAFALAREKGWITG